MPVEGQVVEWGVNEDFRAIGLLDLGEDLLAVVAASCPSDISRLRFLGASKALHGLLSFIEIDTSEALPRYTGGHVLSPSAASSWLVNQVFMLRGCKLRLDGKVDELNELKAVLQLPACEGLQRLTLQSGRAQRDCRSGEWRWRASRNLAAFQLHSLGGAAPALHTLKLQGLVVDISQVGSPCGSDAPCADLHSLSELYLEGCTLLQQPNEVSGRAEASLAGFERLGELQTLSLSQLDHTIELGGEAVASLGRCIHLRRLTVRGHTLASFDCLTALTRLKQLEVQLSTLAPMLSRSEPPTFIEPFDLSPFGALHQLHHLSLTDPQGLTSAAPVDLSPLSACRDLMSLDLSGVHAAPVPYAEPGDVTCKHSACTCVEELYAAGCWPSLESLTLRGCPLRRLVCSAPDLNEGSSRKKGIACHLQ